MSSKGTSIWGLLWLIIVVVVTLTVIVLFSPVVSRVFSNAIAQNERFQAMELASTINFVQASQEGFFYKYDGLPQREKAECVKIFKTYVQVDTQVVEIAQIPQYKSAVKLVGLGTATEQAGTVLADHQPIIVDCKPGRSLVFRKVGANVTITAVQS